MSFASGSLVRARGREWVVLPESEGDFLVLRPLGGTMQETAGLHTALEQVEPATFTPPGAGGLGQSCILSFASGCRSFRISFECRAFPILWAACLPATAIPIGPVAHGVEIRSHPASYRR